MLRRGVILMWLPVLAIVAGCGGDQDTAGTGATEARMPSQVRIVKGRPTVQVQTAPEADRLCEQAYDAPNPRRLEFIDFYRGDENLLLCLLADPDE